MGGVAIGHGRVGVATGMDGVWAGVEGASEGGAAGAGVAEGKVSVAVGDGDSVAGVRPGPVPDEPPPVTADATARGSPETWASESRAGVGLAGGAAVARMVGVAAAVFPEWANSRVFAAAGVGVAVGRAALPLELV